MSVRPRFGGPLQSPEYYAAVSVICNTLREYSTLAVIASHLTAQGLLSPSGKPFNKSRVATFLRSPHYISTK
ncbi:recombinase family protein [Massilia sp.]|uniref:recombinase family protein n=1 Tax=Massilia sp. TaxID=1882437 RepID=UPI003917B6C9